MGGRIGAIARRFHRGEGGGVAVILALSMPALLVVGLGAVQIQAITTDRQKTRDVADAAALWGAQQLTVAPTGADQRAQAFADSQLDGVKANAAVTITATITGKTEMTVDIDTQRPGFFLNLLPVGGFQTHVRSVAEGVSQVPLCVLIFGSAAGNNIHATGSSVLQAPACAVHANQAVNADPQAAIQGAKVEAGTTSSGAITPAADTGAPSIPDPFTALNLNPPVPCVLPLPGDVQIKANTTLDASSPVTSVHLANITVMNGSTLTLSPGVHYFCGDLNLKNKANLVGDGVTLVFAANSQLDWHDGGNVSLNGSKTGALAGFVLATSRSKTADFHMNSDAVTNITGALYVPNAKLVVDGSKKAAAGSAWTVLSSQAFDTTGGANLQINANYASSDVPVPTGVGNKAGTSRLTQ